MSRKMKYKPRQPLHAFGIRLQETRAGMPRTWWAKRWYEAVESKDLNSRFGRARHYAAYGQVMEIDGIEMATTTGIKASVMGLRTKPYAVSIKFRAPQGAARKKIVESLRNEPMLVARLAANDFPQEVEQIFKREGCDLFPGGKLAEDVYDVTTSCTCPDYANPCKHSMAVLLLLGEEISWRPWRLLQLRGISLEELVK